MSGTLVVFAKAPRPGQVKTRLCPPLTPWQAAELYACMLDDVLAASARFARALGLEPALAVWPPEAGAELAERAPGFRILPQRGAGLAARMEAVVEELADEGRAPLLLRGSDSPALGFAAVEQALEALGDADIVLCPDPDGGYSLVGLRRRIPGVFDHPMSTGRVLVDTVARAEARGRAHRLLGAGFDLDTVDDLARLADWRRDGDASLCPRTLAWLDDHGSWPDAPGPAQRRGSS